MNNCKRCKHWYMSIDKRTGECRRYPPINGLWSVTDEDKYCGEYELARCDGRMTKGYAPPHIIRAAEAVEGDVQVDFQKGARSAE